MLMSKEQEYKPVEMEEDVGVPLVGMEMATIARVQAVPMIEVVAPATLPEGYAFEAQVGDRVYTVTVPQGGIEKGQRFMVPATALEETSWSSIPVGAWKDGICSCFKYGLCYAQCCLTCWFMPCALAQVMQRLNLNWLANPIHRVPPKTSSRIFWLTAAFMVCNHILEIAVEALDPHGNSTANNGYNNSTATNGYNPHESNTANPTGDIPTPFYVFRFLKNALAFVFFVYVLIITIKTRRYIRKKYAIRAQNCGEPLEDCCCSFWCQGCTICQMERHTADSGTYSARCCTSTGSASNAPAIV